MLDREADVFGFDHTEAGRWLAVSWDIPLDLQSIAGRHHDRPSGAGVDLLLLIQHAVQMADALSFGVVDSLGRRTPAELAAEAPAEMREVFERDPEELAQLLSTRIDALDGAVVVAQPEPDVEQVAHEPEGAAEADAEPDDEDAARAALHGRSASLRRSQRPWPIWSCGGERSASGLGHALHALLETLGKLFDLLRFPHAFQAVDMRGLLLDLFFQLGGELADPRDVLE